MTIVGISGGLSIDHLVTAPTDVRFDQLGGPGLYAALGASLVAGTEVRLHTALPRSTPEFTRTLRAAGVDLGTCTEVPDVPRLWILNSAQGRRIVHTKPPLGLELDARDGPDPECDNAELPTAFLRELDGILYCAPRSIHATSNGSVVGVDPDQHQIHSRGSEYWRAIAIPGGVLLPSRVQLATLGPEPHIAAQQLAASTGLCVAARLDTEGAYAVDPTGRHWTIRDDHAEIADTTGAGDASAGAIVAALAAGADLATATALGVSAARVVLSDWGHTAMSRHPPLAGPLPGVHITAQHGAT